MGFHFVQGTSEGASIVPGVETSNSNSMIFIETSLVHQRTYMGLMPVSLPKISTYFSQTASLMFMFRDKRFMG